MESLTVDATIENIEPVTAFIDGLLEASDCPMKAQMQIDVAVDEIFGNIANYAYGDKVGKATVTAGYNSEKGEFSITFSDNGKPYNPLEKADPDVTLSAEERGIGGLGIYLVKKTMDDLFYDHVDEQNVFTIVKKF